MSDTQEHLDWQNALDRRVATAERRYETGTPLTPEDTAVIALKYPEKFTTMIALKDARDYCIHCDRTTVPCDGSCSLPGVPGLAGARVGSADEVDRSIVWESRGSRWEAETVLSVVGMGKAEAEVLLAVAGDLHRERTGVAATAHVVHGGLREQLAVVRGEEGDPEAFAPMTSRRAAREFVDANGGTLVVRLVSDWVASLDFSRRPG